MSGTAPEGVLSMEEMARLNEMGEVVTQGQNLSPEDKESLTDMVRAKEWWDALKWYESDLSTKHEDYLVCLFIQLRRDGDLMAQLTEDEIAGYGQGEVGSFEILDCFSNFSEEELLEEIPSEELEETPSNAREDEIAAYGQGKVGGFKILDFPTPDKQDLSTPDPNSKGERDSGHLQLQVHQYSDATVSMSDRGSISGGNAPEEDCPSHFSEEEELEEIDLSSKEMKSLPQYIFKLVSLRKLFLRSCAILMMELPPEIGELTNLEVLDLEGTEILCLPKEIAKLVKLTCLKVSFYGYANQTVIPKMVLSNLSRLKELIIDVTPYGEWWDIEVEAIIDDLRNLKELTTLKLYLPTPELLEYVTLIFPSLANSRFTVGRQKEHFISRLPRDVEEEFNNWEKLEKGLKFINGDCIPNEITKVLKHADAFFLQHHWTAESLSKFGHENLNEVKFFLVMECNEFQTIIDSEKLYQGKDGRAESEVFPGFDEAMVLGSLQRLIIRHMKNIESIWKGLVGKGSLSNLKSLALHTCPNLTTLFTIDMLSNLKNLEELIVEDCPKINSLVSLKSSDSKSDVFLPSLKKISLLQLPELISISNGVWIAPKLERLVIFYCPKLEKLSTTEVSSAELKVIKGEKEWWDALKWYESDLSTKHEDYLVCLFIPLRRDGDLMAQLTEDEIAGYGQGEVGSFKILDCFSNFSEEELLEEIPSEELEETPSNAREDEIAAYGQGKVEGSFTQKKVKSWSSTDCFSNFSEEELLEEIPSEELEETPSNAREDEIAAYGQGKVEGSFTQKKVGGFKILENKLRTFVLNMNLHSKAVAKDVKKLVLNKIEGVNSADVIDREQGKVRISGNVDPQTVIEKFKTHMKKHAELLVEEEEEEESPPKIKNQETQIGHKPVRKFVDQRKVLPARDCYPAHDHELELKCFNKPFTCSRCMEDGFTSGYRCKLCVYDIHKECMNPKPKISHKLFPGSVFEFRQKPHINGSICDACGMIINGCSYRCEAHNLDLHPRCSNLPVKLSIDRTDFLLICKNIEQRCFSCKMKLRSQLVEEKVPGWCYVSERYKFYCHVYCVFQMVQEAWRRGDLVPKDDDDNDGTSKALEKVNLKLVAKSNGSGGRGGRLFLKAVNAFLKAIVGILFGDPTGLIGFAVTELVQN